MDIAKIDKNFELPKAEREDIEWFDVQAMHNMVFGVFYDEKAGRYNRVPQEIADTVNEGVAYLCKHTAGGRLRFRTNSTYIALKGLLDNIPFMFHMPATGSHGFSIYCNNFFSGPFISNPEWHQGNMKSGENNIAFASGKELTLEGIKEIEIYFPLYNGVKLLYVGIQKGCTIEQARDYKYKKPVVYYGNSVTQGGCASHPGNDYQGHLSRWLDCDYINLGFSGNGKGEPEIAEYLASLSASVFVLDYDFNAPSVEHLQKTHYPLYKTIRDKNPDTPIIFISRPVKLRDYVERRAVIYDTYQKAKKDGDKNVWFIDGITLFGDKDADACTVDCVHPNDLGFYRMAEGIRPVLEEALKTQKE